MNAFIQFYWLISNQLYVLLGLTVIDFVFGVILALRQKRFQWSKIAGYIDSDILPILGWVVISAIRMIPADYVPLNLDAILPAGVYVTVFLKIFASVASHLAAVGVLNNTLQSVGITPTGEKPPAGIVK